VWQELTTTKAWVLTGLKEEDDEDSVSGATSYIEDKFEAPADPPSSFGARLHDAETALAAYGG
jgi:hypothetical protein